MLAARRQSLRLGLVTETYPPEINGVANTLRHLVAGLQGRGHRIQLIRPRQRGEVALGAGPAADVCLVPGLPIPRYSGLRFGLPVYRRLRRCWREMPPDAVYIATQGPLGHAALSATRALGIPALTGFHTRFHEYSRHYGLGGLSHLILAVLRRFHNRSAATLVPTAELREELAQLGLERLRVLGRGVDMELFDPQRRREELRLGWGCAPGGLAVLNVGRLAAEKNLALMLRAFEGIASNCPGAKLVLVGDGPERVRLRKLHPRVVLTGPKVGAELAEHYASADLFLFPSLTETFGNVVPEAMASGLAVVAFDEGAARVCIRSSENGVTVPAGNAQAFCDAAVAIAQDATTRGQMARKARLSAERMGWDRVSEELEGLLLEAIDRHRREDRHETLAATTK